VRAAAEISRRNFLASTDNDLFVKIDASQHAGSGVCNEGGDLIMYRRTSFDMQFLFFREQIIAKGVLGWILGPPGTGKSATSFAFISSLDKEWDVVWIHLTRQGDAFVIMLDGEEKHTFYCSENDVFDLLKEMRHQPSVTNNFLIIDGYVHEETGHHAILGEAKVWRSQNRLKRRLAVVSSMTTRGKVNYADDKKSNLLDLMVDSWTLEEHLQAIRHEEFSRSVLFFLDSIDPTECPSHEEMVEEKFLVAGGCARYMFGMCASDVKRSICDAIASLEASPSANILSAGQRSGNAINRLFNQYRDAVGRIFTTFVSKFAEIEMALVKGPQAVKELFRLIREFSSGSTAGGMFEAIFFVRMRCDGISVKCFNGTIFTLEAAKFNDYHVNMETISYDGRRLWLRPVVENQIGFHAVYVDKDAKFARFVQLARGKTHSFKMDGCNTLLNKLHDCQIEVVEFCFVVREIFLHTFRISGGKNITGRGCLSAYKVAGKERMWEHGSEERDAVIMAMDDII
jgi:hypothetical protein